MFSVVLEKIGDFPIITMVKTNTHDHPIPPEDVEAEEGTYAVAIHRGGQTIFKYEQPSPLRSEPEWEERDHFDHDEVPRMNLRNAVIDYEPSSGGLEVVWVITDQLQADEGKPPDEQTETRVETQSERTPRRYVVELSDGERFSDSQQQNVMGKVVDYLVEEYNLIDRIDLPYMSGYKNALVNTEPKHPDPDRSDMLAPYELSSGDYLHTKMSGDQKKQQLLELADECGLDVKFSGQW